MAFVVISHLDSSHPSMLPELLQKDTSLAVLRIEEGMLLRSRHVYVIPPNYYVAVSDYHFELTQSVSSSDVRAPVSHFFRSLAKQCGDMAVGVILSGMGSDGSAGLQAIKEQLGLVMVQDPVTAKYDGMPRAAVQTGLVDFVLAPEDMPAELIEYINRLLDHQSVPDEQVSDNALKRIHAILRSRSGHDFSHCKESTIRRRIHRRINVHGHSTTEKYVRYLQQRPDEIQALIKELLIGVTQFFRDPEAFKALKNDALSKLFESKSPGDDVRVWVAGCATGEEAYSLAIVLHEFIEEHRHEVDIQVFATDLDDDAVNFARSGIYPAGISADVAPERLNRYFKKEKNQYRLQPFIREKIIFAQQSLIRDPPFTKIDLISCRNLLIYLNSDIQKKLLPLFHYSLNPGGILFLGTSETIGTSMDLFISLDNHWKIFRRKNGEAVRKKPLDFPLTTPKVEAGLSATRHTPDSLANIVHRVLLDHHVPPAIIIDSHGDIRFIHGRVQKYLEHAQGQVNSYNALDMARDGLKLTLTSTIAVMRPDAHPVVKRVHVKQNGHIIDVLLTVAPMPEKDARGLYLAAFQDISRQEQQDAESSGEKQIGPKDASGVIQDMERKLRICEEKLRTTVEELESSNEELRSANEEYQSTNEELQSTNEELNSSKEELQSLNKEMSHRLTIANQAWRLAQNIIDPVRDPFLVLDHQFRVVSANQSFYQAFRLDADHVENKRIFDLMKGEWDIPELKKLLQDLVQEKKDFYDYEIERNFSKLGRKIMLLNARIIRDEVGIEDCILLTFEDTSR
jgi:two-component system, chemotaxis family, CheB/CheR fusion protein